MMGIIFAGMVVTTSDGLTQGVNALGWAILPFTILAGQYHLANWYTECNLPADWRIATTENGWTTNAVDLDWIKRLPYRASGQAGREEAVWKWGRASALAHTYNRSFRPALTSVQGYAFYIVCRTGRQAAPFSIRLLEHEADNGGDTARHVNEHLSSVLPASYRTESDDLAAPARHVTACIDKELDLRRLTSIHDWLWIVGRPMPPRPLHYQLLVRREILVTEQMDMHLVWTTGRIFVKPVPSFLLDPRFWTEYLCCFLFSYAALISHESDFRIAEEKHLLPQGLKWPAWRTFVEQLDTEHVYGDIDPRFCYGELRLSRLNEIYFLFRTPFRGYMSRWNQYGSFFRDNLAWLAGTTVYIAIVLTAMQVGLVTDILKDNHGFQSASWLTFCNGLLPAHGDAAMDSMIVGLVLILFTFIIPVLLATLTLKAYLSVITPAILLLLSYLWLIEKIAPPESQSRKDSILGLSRVYPLEEGSISSTEIPGSDTRTAVIFVHGLGANPATTWRSGGICWITDFLPDDFKDLGYQSRVRLFLFNYKSFWLRRSRLRLGETANALRQELKSDEVLRDDIILVGHSYGGLVIKKALAMSPELKQRLKGIIFLGTPHQGASASRYGRLISYILAPLGSDVDIMRVLEPGSEDLYDLQTDFHNHFKDTTRKYFFEKEKTYHQLWGFITWLDEFVVTKLSATWGADGLDVVGLDTDHRGMNKFSRRDNNYRLVSREILAMLRRKSVIPYTRSPWQTELREFLKGNHHIPKYDPPYVNIQPCDWLYKLERYTAWAGRGTLSSYLEKLKAATPLSFTFLTKTRSRSGHT
ncbi:hypothetical protein VTI74DRAFT_270 [Chaetomium olivicolor]